jgi:hypothetical protein
MRVHQHTTDDMPDVCKTCGRCPRCEPVGSGHGTLLETTSAPVEGWPQALMGSTIAIMLGLCIMAALGAIRLEIRF